MASESPNDEHLRELLFQFLEELDTADESPEKLIDRYCEEAPELSVEFARSIEELKDAGLLGDVDSPEVPEYYAGYRIERRLGAGGMGTVYLARKSATGTLVALKVVHAAELLLGGRSRFAREADAVRFLDHPGVAKLLDASLDGDEPYLAFDYVEGLSLEAAIRRAELLEPQARASEVLGQRTPSALHSPWVSGASQAILQVADALQHAHGRGVLHRDLKPANIIVGPDGSTTLVDFGLASLVGAQRLTRTGTQLGSLPYMAPEQIRQAKNSTSAQSDVYSLGVTFYELLTLHHPFLNHNPETVRRHILEGRCLSVRDHMPDIPSTINTVCMKAMETDSKYRYRDVAAFADDLQRALEGRPIVGRPPSLLRKARGWSRRRPALSAALAALLLLLVVVPLVYAATVAKGARRMADLNEKLTLALDNAESAQVKAEEHLARMTKSTAIARRSIMDLSIRVASEKLPDVPHYAEISNELLVSSRELYEELRENDPEDLGVLRDLATLIKLHSVSLWDMGEDDEAEIAFNEMDGVLERMIEKGESPTRVHAEYASAGYMRVGMLFGRFQYEPALELAEETIEHCREALKVDPDQDKVVLIRLALLGRAASAAAHLGRPEVAAGHAQAAQGVVGELLARDEPKELYLVQAGRALHDLRTVAARAGRFEEAIALSQRGLECGDRVLLSSPESATGQFIRAQALSGHGDTLRLEGTDLEAAAAMLMSAQEAVRPLVEKFPGVGDYSSLLGQSTGRLANVKAQMGDELGALELSKELVRTALERYDESPDVTALRSRALLSLLNGSNAAMQVPVEKWSKAESHGLAVLYLDRAQAILGTMSEGELRAMNHIVIRLYHHAVEAHAGLGQAAAWDALERMEALFPAGIGESLVALEAYHFALPLVAGGALPTDQADALMALEAVRVRVVEHLRHFSSSAASTAADLDSLTELVQFEDDPAIEELMRTLRERGD